MSMTLTVSQWIRFLLPMFSGFFVSSLPKCRPGKSAGVIAKFRPPSFVFGLVWPVLYLLLGGAWVYTQSHTKVSQTWVDFCYGTLVFFLTTWIVVYGCLGHKKTGVYIIFLSLLTTMVSRDISPTLPRIMLAPLLVWLLFAGLISIFEVQFT